MKRTTIKEIANLLREKDKEKPIILFLGARTGNLFGNEKLYEQVTKYSTPTFDMLSDEQKFHTCYKILGTSFSELERHNLFLALSKKHDDRPEDRYLAELIKANFFDVIISTNIDSLLEDALQSEKVEERRPYHLLIYGKDFDPQIIGRKQDIVLKIFGDLVSRTYKTAGDEFLIEDDEVLRDSIEDLMDSIVLMVGYDSEWDGPLNKTIFKKGEQVIYVNETELTEEIPIAGILEERKSTYLIGKVGAYKYFIRELYAELFKDSIMAYEAMQKISRQIVQLNKEVTSKHEQVQEEIANLKEDIAHLHEAIRNLDEWLRRSRN